MEGKSSKRRNYEPLKKGGPNKMHVFSSIIFLFHDMSLQYVRTSISFYILMLNICRFAIFNYLFLYLFSGNYELNILNMQLKNTYLIPSC